MAGGGFDDNDILKGSLFRKVQLGTFGTGLTQRGLAVRDLFRKSGFGVQEHRDFRGWLWIHFAVNAGLHSQALQAGSMQRLMGSTEALKNAILNVRELLPVLKLSDSVRLVLESHKNQSSPRNRAQSSPPDLRARCALSQTQNVSEA